MHFWVRSAAAQTPAPVAGTGKRKRLHFVQPLFGGYLVMYWVSNASPPPEVPQEILESYDQTSEYVNKFLVDQHPFRKGHVCPFVKSSLSMDGLIFSFVRQTHKKDLVKEIILIIQEYIDFKSNFSDSQSGMVILFPPDFSEETLVDLQLHFKGYCIKRKIMMGALYPNSTAPSLHSEDYFPLRTPTPTLVLRDLVPMDIQFLTQDRHHAASKILFLKHYISKFTEHPSKAVRERVNEARITRKKLKLFLASRVGAIIIGLCLPISFLGAYFAL